MVRTGIFVLLGTGLLSGCYSVGTSQLPLATSYPLSTQQKMQAAHHWGVLAEHEASQVLANPWITGRALNIRSATDSPTPFAEAFDSLLTSQLVARGAYVRTTPENAMSLTWKAQVVQHRDPRPHRAHEGLWTALAAGVAVATLPVNNWSEPALALIPGAALVDLYSGNWWTSPERHEVLITTRIEDAGRVVYSSSNIYYINSLDQDHYRVVNGVPTVRLTDSW